MRCGPLPPWAVPAVQTRAQRFSLICSSGRAAHQPPSRRRAPGPPGWSSGSGAYPQAGFVGHGQLVKASHLSQRIGLRASRRFNDQKNGFRLPCLQAPEPSPRCGWQPGTGTGEDPRRGSHGILGGFKLWKMAREVMDLNSALTFLTASLFVLPASASAISIDPKIHKQCKDARDYAGCVKAFTTPQQQPEDGLSGLRAAMKQVAARIRGGFSLRDSTLFFQPLTDQLSLVRSTHPESLAVESASKAEQLFSVIQTAWRLRINSLSMVMGPTYSCTPTQQGVEGFNRVAGSQVITYSVSGGGLFAIGCSASVGERHEAMMLSYVAGLLDSGSVSPEEIAARKKAAEERRAQAERERELCAMGPWNRYLEENPGIKKWAQANPAAANATKEKFLTNPKNQKDCSPVGN